MLLSSFKNIPFFLIQRKFIFMAHLPIIDSCIINVLVKGEKKRRMFYKRTKKILFLLKRTAMTSHQRHHQKAGLIKKNQIGFQARGFFLIRGHSTLIHR